MMHFRENSQVRLTSGPPNANHVYAQGQILLHAGVLARPGRHWKDMAKTAKKTTKRKASSAGKSSGSKSMGKNLVIVESPAKAKTINRYLGTEYVVKASMGHVRDLPPKEMGVDIANHFTPTYEPLATRKKVLAELKKLAKAAPTVYLATDLDREGEAIAWHLAEELKVPEEKIQRVVFNEITASAIRDAFKHPSTLDMKKVNAQQARRILDRIVGYEVSPLLWKKVARGLSAGRVQSVAVRLVVERERERDAFCPEEYWRIGGIFTPDMASAAGVSKSWQEFLAQRNEKGNPPTKDAQQQFLTENSAFRTELAKWKGEKFDAENADQALEVIKALAITIDNLDTVENPDAKGPAAKETSVTTSIGPSAAKFTVGDINQRERKSNPPAPFTTSTLQQAASVQMHFSTSRTMRVAQQLYEGLDLPVEGHVGLITYMRTDSTQLSNDALTQIRSHIQGTCGDGYTPEKPRHYTAGKRAQEAHEAIRPTDVTRTPEKMRAVLDDAQFKLYQLIWKRCVACQMTPAVWKITEMAIVAQTPEGQADFKALGRRLGFDGYLRVAGLPKGGDQILPELELGSPIAPVDIDPAQHFTQPPPRYTEASLVKALEAEGIGRPSTYASIIKTIQDRSYAEIQDRAFRPTHLGMIVTDKLVKHLPKIFDVRFTAHMEDQLDQIEDADRKWQSVLEDFYTPFHENLEKAAEEMVHAKAESQPSEYKCKECGKDMAYRFNKNGRYLACSGYPECKETCPVDEDGKIMRPQGMDVACPKCSGALMLRKGRFGPFLSCPKYPECDGIVNLDKKGFIKHPTCPPLLIDEIKCNKCQAPVNLRRGKRGPWLSCSAFPKCRGRVGWTTLDEEQKKALELKLLNHENENPVARICDMNGNPLGDEHIPVALPDLPDEEAEQAEQAAKASPEATEAPSKNGSDE